MALRMALRKAPPWRMLLRGMCRKCAIDVRVGCSSTVVIVWSTLMLVRLKHAVIWLLLAVLLRQMPVI